MIRTTLPAFAAVVASFSLMSSCSSPRAPADAQDDAVADTSNDVGHSLDVAADVADAPVGMDTPVAPDAVDTMVRADVVSRDAADVTGDAPTPLLDWYPGNYGLVQTGNNSARDAFFTAPLAGAFDGVEMIYPWATCEPAAMGDYTECFNAINRDIDALPPSSHIILFLQYKQFATGSGVTTVVPPYLRMGPGAWCVTPTSGGPPVCGEYTTPNGVIAMIWNDAVVTRLRAWFAAVGDHYRPGGPEDARGRRIAGIALPETASGTNPSIPIGEVGYTSTRYLTAIEDNLLALVTAFPTKPVFQYINFLPGSSDMSGDLMSLGDFALGHPHVGLGCPDVAGNGTFSPPGYATLINPRYQLHLPFNVAIEMMDFSAAYTTGVDATYTEATARAPAGMAAQFVVWMHVTGGGNVFMINDVATWIRSHPNPNRLPPM